MKVVNLASYNRNVLRALFSLRVIEKDIPSLEPGTVLVKIHAASCNPSDIAFIQGGYNIIKTLPAVPGFEGSGTIIETGEGAEALLGKKVSCFVQDDADGTWAEYVKVKTGDLIVLDDAFDLDQAACFTVNPFTAYAMIDFALQNKSKVVVMNAAGGQVPALVRQLAKVNDLQTINIVRKSETAVFLKEEGVEYVLEEQQEDFGERLKEWAGRMKATTAFDAVSGPLSGTMINAMPAGSHLIVYGGLSNKAVSEIMPADLIFKDKKIYGFNLVDWKKEKGRNKFDAVADELQRMFIEGTLHTKIQQKIPIDDVVVGLKNYLGNMSGGKVLIKP